MSFGTAASSMNEQGCGVALLGFFFFALMATSKDGISIPGNVHMMQLLSSEAFFISFESSESYLAVCPPSCHQHRKIKQEQQLMKKITSWSQRQSTCTGTNKDVFFSFIFSLLLYAIYSKAPEL